MKGSTCSSWKAMDIKIKWFNIEKIENLRWRNHAEWLLPRNTIVKLLKLFKTLLETEFM